MNLVIKGSKFIRKGRKQVWSEWVWEQQLGHLRIEFGGDEVARKATTTPEKSVDRQAVKPASATRAHESAEAA